jgi:hypothetical protein
MHLRAKHSTHACNPRYLEGWDWKDCGCRPTWAKSSGDPISTNRCALTLTSVIPARRIKLKNCSPGWLEHKARPFAENCQSKNDWGWGSSGRTSKWEALSSNPSTAKKRNILRSWWVLELAFGPGQKGVTSVHGHQAAAPLRPWRSPGRGDGSSCPEPDRSSSMASLQPWLWTQSTHARGPWETGDI